MYRVRAKRHSFLEIIESILENLVEGQLKQSYIQTRAGLEHTTVSRYLTLLLELKLIGNSREDPSCVIITQKGREFLRYYDSKIKKILNPD